MGGEEEGGVCGRVGGRERGKKGLKQWMQCVQRESSEGGCTKTGEGRLSSSS